MKSVGEVMAIGRTFKEALQKGIRSLEPAHPGAPRRKRRSRCCAKNSPRRVRIAFTGFLRPSSAACPLGEICELTKIDPWFIQQIEEIMPGQSPRRLPSPSKPPPSELLREVKRIGTSDEHLAQFGRPRPPRCACSAPRYGVGPVFKRVDTCAAEFESFTPYMYSTYEDEDEADATQAAKNHDSRQRSQPHRAGNRIRLLLLPRLASLCAKTATKPSW